MVSQGIKQAGCPMLIMQRTKNTSVLLTNGEHEMKIYVFDMYHHEKYGSMVKLGLDFPDSYKIYREEVACAIRLGISLPEARRYIFNMRRAHHENNPRYTH